MVHTKHGLVKKNIKDIPVSSRRFKHKLLNNISRKYPPLSEGGGWGGGRGGMYMKGIFTVRTEKFIRFQQTPKLERERDLEQTFP
jgi:hypothetical protein